MENLGMKDLIGEPVMHEELDIDSIDPIIQGSINDIELTSDTFEKALNENIENSQEIKDGVYTEEDERNEPGNILYNAILDTSMTILKSPAVSNAFSNMSKSIDPDTVKAIMELMTVSMTNSAYNAILTYDEMLKAELGRNFNILESQMNLLNGTTVNSEAMIQIHKIKIGKIEDRLKIEDLENDIK